jgi:PKD repeat protein
MKKLNLITAAALTVLNLSNADAQSPYQFIKVTVTSNSNNLLQAPATTVLMFGQGENDSLMFPDAGNEASIGHLSDDVFPFSITADNYVITNFDSRSELNTYKSVPFGFVSKNPGEIKVVASVSNSNDDTVVNLPGFVWLEQISTGEKFSILNDTAKFDIVANANFASDFILHTGPAFAPAFTTESCYNTSDATVTINTPNYAGCYFELKDAIGIIASGTIAGTDTIITNLPAGSYTAEVKINGIPVDSTTLMIDPRNTLIADFYADYNSIIIGDSVTLTDISTGGMTYLWNFGDGDTCTTTGTVSHTYYVTGNFTVSLTVSDTSGCSASMTDIISVNYAPIANPQTNTGHGSPQVQDRAQETQVIYTEGAITVSAEQNVNITITSVTGALIYSGVQNNTTAKYNVPANGVYLVTTIDAQGNKNVTTVTAL